MENKAGTVIFANITYKPFYGGIENSIYYMSQTILQKGYNAVIFASDSSLEKDKRLPKKENEGGVDIIRFWRIHSWGPFALIDPLFLLLSALIGFLQLKKQYGARTQLVIRSHVIAYAAYLAGFKNIIYLVPSMVKGLDDRGNSHVDFITKLKKLVLLKTNIRMYMWLQKNAIKRCTTCAVFSVNMKRQILDFIGEREILIVKPGVATDIFKFDKQRRKICKENYGLANCFIFLCIGRIIEAKGFEDVIRAYGILPEYVKANSKVLIVGDGPEKKRLVNLVKQKNERNIVFFDSTIKPAEFYNLSDCFMMTSRYEAFGQTTLEAMASGLPVIGYNPDGENIITAIKELVENGKNGLLCCFDVTELSKKMMTIYNTSLAGLEEYAMNNVSKVNNEFSWDKLVNTLLSK